LVVFIALDFIAGENFSFARRHRKGWPLSLRRISAALADAGHVNGNGAPYAAASVKRMLAQ
jgi:hypothetical protein